MLYVLDIYFKVSPPANSDNAVLNALKSINPFASVAFSIVFMVLGYANLRRALKNAKRFENFEEYKDSLMQKWGELDPPKLH